MDALFRDGLLDGCLVALAGEPPPLVGSRLTALGADVRPLSLTDDEEAVGAAAAELSNADALVVDTAGDGLELIRTWNGVRAMATAAMIPGDRGGKVVLLAPAPPKVAHAEAMRAAVENLARTLSVEWARFGIRLTAVAPGDATDPGVVAGLVAYLLSPAGDYFSGTRLELG